MNFRDYPIDKSVADPLEEYARDNSLNTSSIIERLINNFLSHEEYLKVDDVITKTPEELYSERRNRFRKVNKGNQFQLYFDDWSYGAFPANDIDDIIGKLIDFSDEELIEMSKENWEYRKGMYKPFIYEKLEDSSITPEKFMALHRFNIKCREKSQDYYFEGELIASFNRNKYSVETIEKAELFLINRSDEEIKGMIDKRKKSDLTSAEFVLTYSQNSENLPYVYKNQSGSEYILKSRVNYGTYDSENITSVWHFLNDNNWDLKYSTKHSGLCGEKHAEWVLSQIMNQTQLPMTKKQSVLMEGK